MVLNEAFPFQKTLSDLVVADLTGAHIASCTAAWPHTSIDIYARARDGRHKQAPVKSNALNLLQYLVRQLPKSRSKQNKHNRTRLRACAGRSHTHTHTHTRRDGSTAVHSGMQWSRHASSSNINSREMKRRSSTFLHYNVKQERGCPFLVHLHLVTGMQHQAAVNQQRLAHHQQQLPGH